MSDLVTRLRRGCDCSEKVCEMDSFSEQAADRIEQLEAAMKEAFDMAHKDSSECRRILFAALKVIEDE